MRVEWMETKCILLLAQGYSEVVLLDLRYLASDFVSQLAKTGLINFENADVLFMYSTLLLNNSTGMK